MKSVTGLSALALGMVIAGCGAPNEGDEDVSQAAATPSYTFGIGSGLTTGDFRMATEDFSEHFFYGGGYPNNSFVEGTYSSRFTRYPEAVWGQSYQNGNYAIRNAGLFDNEEVWATWNLNTETTLIPACGGKLQLTPSWTVSLDYDVDSEPNYDWFTVTSVDDSCTGTKVRARVSGLQSGHVSFSLPQHCPSAFVSIDYHKDESVSVGADMARVRNVTFYEETVTPVCP